MDKQLSQKFNQKQFVESWTKSKKGLQEGERLMKEYIEKNTAPEMEAVEKAMKQYQDKLNSINRDDKFIKIRQKTETYANEVEQHIIKASSIFEKERIRVMDDPNLSPEEKQIRIMKIHEYIMTKMYTKKEIDEFRSRTITFLL